MVSVLSLTPARAELVIAAPPSRESLVVAGKKPEAGGKTSRFPGSGVPSRMVAVRGLERVPIGGKRRARSPLRAKRAKRGEGALARRARQREALGG
jgi:hypothetical protein